MLGTFQEVAQDGGEFRRAICQSNEKNVSDALPIEPVVGRKRTESMSPWREQKGPNIGIALRLLESTPMGCKGPSFSTISTCVGSNL